MNPERMPKPPADPWPTVKYLARSVAATGSLLAEDRVHLSRRNVGTTLPCTDCGDGEGATVTVQR